MGRTRSRTPSRKLCGRFQRQITASTQSSIIWPPFQGTQTFLTNYVVLFLGSKTLGTFKPNLLQSSIHFKVGTQTFITTLGTFLNPKFYNQTSISRLIYQKSLKIFHLPCTYPCKIRNNLF